MRFLSILLLVLLFVTEAMAQTTSPLGKHQPFFRLLFNDATEARMGYRYQPSQKEDKGPGKFDLHFAHLDFEVPIPVNQNFYYRAGGTYEMRRYKFRGDAELSSKMVHETSALFGFGGFVSDDLLLTAAARAGLYTDFDDNIDGDDFRVHGKGKVVYRLNPGAQVLAGVAYTEDFDSTPFYPMVGLRLLSDDGRVHVSITFPVEARLGYNINTATQVYFRGLIDGDKYTIRMNEEEFNLQRHDRVLALGINRWLGNHVSLGAEAGLSLGSELKLKSESVAGFDGDLDWGPFVAVNLGVSFD